MSDIDTVISAIEGCTDLPAEVRALGCEANSIEPATFDKTYIEFLDEQILLNARGTEWTQMLIKRRRNLAGYVEAQLLNATLKINGTEYRFKISPASGQVVHWESVK